MADVVMAEWFSSILLLVLVLVLLVLVLALVVLMVVLMVMLKVMMMVMEAGCPDIYEHDDGGAMMSGKLLPGDFRRVT